MRRWLIWSYILVLTYLAHVPCLVFVAVELLLSFCLPAPSPLAIQWVKKNEKCFLHLTGKQDTFFKKTNLYFVVVYKNALHLSNCWGGGCFNPEHTKEDPPPLPYYFFFYLLGKWRLTCYRSQYPRQVAHGTGWDSLFFF